MLLVCDNPSSRANLSSIVRLAGCFGLEAIAVSGNVRVDPEIAREAVASVRIDRKRTLPSFLDDLRSRGYRLVALEQATGAVPLTKFAFVARTALVIGNERRGL